MPWVDEDKRINPYTSTPKSRRAARRNAKKAHAANRGLPRTRKQLISSKKNLKLAQAAAKKVESWKLASKASMKINSIKKARKAYRSALIKRAKEAKCEICKMLCFPRKDHCHKTGKRRGILCNQCNLGLGHFKDRPELLREAARYIEKYAIVIRFPRIMRFPRFEEIAA